MDCLFTFRKNTAEVTGGAWYSKLSPFQKAINDKVGGFNGPTNFTEGFLDGIGVPIPVIGGPIKRDMDLHKNMAVGIGVAVKQGVPGYSREVRTIGGREVTVYTDATNPDKNPFQTTKPKFSPSQIEANKRDYDTALKSGSASAMESRDNFITDNNFNDYQDRLHSFLNEGLVEGLAPDIDVKPVSLKNTQTSELYNGYCALSR